MKLFLSSLLLSLASATVTIDTFVRVVTDTQGNGATLAQVHEQMDVLNEAFANADFSFDLMDVTFTANDEWYSNGRFLSPPEFEMKLSIGPAKTREQLVVYITGFEGGGWTYIPQQVDTGFFDDVDGIVISARTLPGVSEAPFGLGLTLVHEVGE